MTKLEFWKKKVPFTLEKNLDIHSSWKELLGYNKNMFGNTVKSTIYNDYFH